jgi:hypothetical protein
MDAPGTPWLAKASVPVSAVDATPSATPPIRAGSAKSQLEAIQTAISRDLAAHVPGYKKVRGVGDFALRLQSIAQSVHQTRTGNAYPEGALGKAGQPETEQALPKGAAYVDDQPTPGRVMPEIHHEV